jgi:elongation factor G
MSELLGYAPDLRSLTGGQGEFEMELARYEEVPGHLAGKVVQEAAREREAVGA